MTSSVFSNLPCETKIKLLSQQIGSVFLYRDTLIGEKYRLFLLLGCKDETFFFLTFSSKVEQRLQARGESRIALQTLVIVSSTDYAELTQESIIDGNSLLKRDRSWLEAICNQDEFNLRARCPDELRKTVVEATLLSPLVTEAQKVVIRACNSDLGF